MQIDPLATAANATIHNPVQIDPTANAVGVTVQNPVQIDITANNSTLVHDVQLYGSKPIITFAASSPPIEITGHAKRDKLILNAASINTGIIWVGSVANEGAPLAAGERIILAVK